MKYHIVTLNSWGTYGPYESRLPHLISEIKKLTCDILCLQEVADPHLISEVAHQTNLKHTVLFSEPQLAICASLPMLERNDLKYEHKSTLETQCRGVLAATFKLGNVRLIVANTHLSWRKEDEFVRLSQVKELSRFVGAKKMPALLTGDFNDNPDSQPLQLLKTSGFKDLFELCQPSNPGYTWDNQHPFIQSHSVTFPDRRIDFIFANHVLVKQMDKTQASVKFNEPSEKGLYPSDHYGVSCKFEIRNK